MAITSAVIGAASTAYSMSEQKKAAKKQEKAQKTQQKIADVRAQKERRQYVAQQRQLRAQQVAGGFSAGAQDSSALSGALSASSAQQASNVGFSEQVAGLSEQVSIFNIGAAQNQSNAAFAQGIGTGLFGEQGALSPFFGAKV